MINENLGFISVVGFGDNYRTQLRHRIHHRGGGMFKKLIVDVFCA